MKIGVVSDTHSQKMPRQMLEDFKKVDFIIHAGDFCDLEDYNQLSKVKEVKAVFGNMDSPALCRQLPRREIIVCGAVRIGVFHGEGPRKTVLEKVKAEFRAEKVDAVVFGHSHEVMNEVIDGVLFFNPGSATDKISAAYRSYGILEINENSIQGKIIKVKDDG